MRWILCLLMLASLGFAPAPVYKPNKNDIDLEKLQGTWRSISHRYEGRDANSGMIWIFSKDTLAFRLDEDGISIEFRFLVDTRTNPKVLDLDLVGEGRGRVIYTLEGDKLTVCFNAGLSIAPRGFGGGEKQENLIVFERRKDR